MRKLSHNNVGGNVYITELADLAARRSRCLMRVLPDDSPPHKVRYYLQIDKGMRHAGIEMIKNAEAVYRY